MTTNETRNTRLQELKEEAKKLRKTAYAATERHDPRGYGKCERALQSIHIEIWEIENNKTWNS